MKKLINKLFNKIGDYKTAYFCMAFSIIWVVGAVMSFAAANQSHEIMCVGLAILNIIGTVYYFGEEGELAYEDLPNVYDYYELKKSATKDFYHVA